MTDTHIPFHVRESQTHEEHAVLQEGVPDWMWGSLWAWCRRSLVRQSNAFSFPNGEVIRHLENVLHVVLPFKENSTEDFPQLLDLFKVRPNLFLSVAEALANGHGFERAATLKLILDNAGSAFELAPRAKPLKNGVRLFVLLRRVAPEVRAAYEHTLSTAGKAGDYLQEAWQYVYRRDPDPGAGYRMAVNAVEAVACPLFTPADTTPTLGKVIGRMKQGGDKFAVHLQPAGGNAIGKVQALCELIWTAQLDRHGSADPAAPLNVSKQEAEMALHTAITLVHWFSTGMVTLKA